MRRRGDQGHARVAVTQPGDQFVHLAPGQLPAFARLGSLRDLDLQDLGVDQVLRRNAKPPGSHLLDLGGPVGPVTRRILAPFPRIGTGTQTVHGFRESLVRIRRQRTQRHAGRIKARGDLFYRFYFFDRDGFDILAQPQQVAQHHRFAAVYQALEYPVVLHIATARSRLKGLHDVRVERVVFLVMHVLQQPALP